MKAAQPQCEHPPNTHSDIRFLVDRMHVSTSHRAIVRNFWNRLPKEQRGYTDRDVRHGYYRGAFMIHAENRGIFDYVQRGRNARRDQPSAPDLASG